MMKKYFFLFIFCLISIFNYAQKGKLALIILKNNDTVKSEVSLPVHLFAPQKIDESGVCKKIATIDEFGNKKVYKSDEIKYLKFIDFEGSERIFESLENTLLANYVYDDNLAEVLVNGKIKWYRTYKFNSMQGYDDVNDYLIKDNKDVFVFPFFGGTKKKMKEFMKDKPDIDTIIKETNFSYVPSIMQLVIWYNEN